MLFFYSIRFTKKRRLLFYSICLAFILICLYRFLFPPATHNVALIKGNSTVKHLALTFHLNWGEEKASEIIQVLKKKDIRATFFISGEWAERHPQILASLTENKHEIGLLGYEYKNYLVQNKTTIQKDIMLAQASLKKLGYEKIPYIRSPIGSFNKDVIEMLKGMNLETVHWDIDANDTDQPNAKTLEKRLLQEISNGSIILLHASDDAKHTAKALEKVIPSLLKRDFQFKTISELKYNIEMKESFLK